MYARVILNGSDQKIYQGMIPVIIESDGKVKVADIHDIWYDYETHNWANIVLIDTTPSAVKNKYFNNDMTLKSEIEGTIIPESEIYIIYMQIQVCLIIEKDY